VEWGTGKGYADNRFAADQISWYKKVKGLEFNYVPGSTHAFVRVVIADTDDGYMDDISRYYQLHHHSIRVTRKVKTLTELYAFTGANETDVVLINLDLMPKAEEEIIQIRNRRVAKTIILTDQIEKLRKLQLDVSNGFVEYAYKYTPMNLLTQRILSFTPRQVQPVHSKSAINDFLGVRQAKKVLFFSPKGGVGKTTLAINTACQLTMKDKKVLLVDFATFGQVSAYLYLPRTRGLTDAIGLLEQEVGSQAELQRTLKESVYQVDIEGKKLDVLSAASHFKMSNMTLDMTDKILEALQALDYEVIVMDTSTDLTPKNIALLSAATDLFYVTTTDVVANWSLLSTFDVVEKLNRPLQSRYLLLNRYHSSIGFPTSELEEILSMPITEIIPDMYQQIQGFTNRGISLIEKPHLKINRHYRRIAHYICPVFTKKELGRGPGLWGVFRRADRRGH
jgi:cellulose biosynthesis protein BcsQ